MNQLALIKEEAFDNMVTPLDGWNPLNESAIPIASTQLSTSELGATPTPEPISENTCDGSNSRMLNEAQQEIIKLRAEVDQLKEHRRLLVGGNEELRKQLAETKSVDETVWKRYDALLVEFSEYKANANRELKEKDDQIKALQADGHANRIDEVNEDGDGMIQDDDNSEEEHSIDEDVGPEVSNVDRHSEVIVDGDNQNQTGRAVPARTRKKFQCDFPDCNKSFTRWYLPVHARIHTGERPFKCDWNGCSKAFAHMANLESHKRSHTGERPYACKWPRCSAKFKSYSNLRNHKRLHSGVRSFVCDWPGCGKKFLLKGSFTCHRKRVHKHS